MNKYEFNTIIIVTFITMIIIISLVIIDRYYEIRVLDNGNIIYDNKIYTLIDDKTK